MIVFFCLFVFNVFPAKFKNFTENDGWCCLFEIFMSQPLKNLTWAEWRFNTWNQCNLGCIIDLPCVNVSFCKWRCDEKLISHAIMSKSFHGGDFRFDCCGFQWSVLKSLLIFYLMPLNIFIISGMCNIKIEMFVIST